MSPREDKSEQHVGPSGNAYAEEQKLVRERNDEARRAGKEEVAERDRKRQADRREEDRRGDVYR
jgi:hypothetical protein